MLMLSLTKCRSCIINIHFGAFTLYSLSNYWYAFSNVTNYCNKDHWITLGHAPDEDEYIGLIESYTATCTSIYAPAFFHFQIQGDLLLSADTQGHVYFWNACTGQSEAAIQAHDAAVNKIAFHKGRFFTAAS